MSLQKNNAKKLPYDRIVLTLQGGGALGAYQVGIISALQEGGYFPDWVVGTSIGAINAALIAGNEPEARIDKLLAFWDKVSSKSMNWFNYVSSNIAFRKMCNYWSAQYTALFGQSGFFQPHFFNLLNLLSPHNTPEALSFYDTSALKSTLENLVDFDRINKCVTRLSVGAVEIESGQMLYFDNKKCKFGPEHIMASGSLPPGFPAVKVEDKFYWDGGISSNTPGILVLEELESDSFKSMLCFMIHLFDSFGLLPTNFDEVFKRKKDIEFSSRFVRIVKKQQEVHQLQYAIHQLGQLIPEENKKDPTIRKWLTQGTPRTASLVRFLYESRPYDLSSKDFEFSYQSVKEHIAAGYKDGIEGIKKAPWLEPVCEVQGIAVHDMAFRRKHLEEL